MTLQAGTRFGAYEILSAVGAGGMGEVYRARDSKLQREVAIKVLPGGVALDPDRLLRFEREAQVLAALNHPNIAHVYGVLEDPPALVMELVEGEDLAQILARGPLPLDRAVSAARQIAEALETAHERGIVHRDLKPANVRVREDGTVKVLDFGLAKAFDPAEGTDVPSAAHSPTFTSPAVAPAGALMTQMGVLLGTAAYMAPEQARGKTVDKRADIWAFGCVLYEMLTGRAAFAGETLTDTLAAIMTRPPDLAALPAGTPAVVRRLLARCLERDPKRRLRDIGEARLMLEDFEHDGEGEPSATGAPPRWHIAVPWTLAAVAALAAAWLAILRPVPQSVDLPPLTYRLSIPGLSLARNTLPALSHDGRRIAYVANRSLWVRDLDQLGPRQVSGVTDPQFPFWSPDGRQIAYVHGGALWRVPAEGGPPVMVAALRFSLGARTPAGVWRADGSIVFASSASDSGLFVVSDQGGDMRVLHAQEAPTESDFHRPSLLPDGDGVLFVVDRTDTGPDTIGLLARGRRKDVLRLEGDVLDSPVYSPTGHILYHRETTAPGVWAVPFSLDRLETTGEPFLVAAGGAWPAITPHGTLIFADTELSGLMQLAWVDRDGSVSAAVADTFPALGSPRISPDGLRVAAIVSTERGEGAAVVFDLRRQTRAVVERPVGPASEVTWLGNDRLVIARTAGPTTSAETLLVRDVEGPGRTDIRARAINPEGARDGGALLFMQPSPGTGPDIWHLADGTPQRVVATSHAEREPALAPDGALLAYSSTETGQPEVFVRPYPHGGPTVQVSSGGGLAPRWSPAGDRIYYRGPVGATGVAEVMEVTVDRRGGLRLGTPRGVPIPGGVETYPGGFDPAADGRLLIVRSAGGRADPSLVVMQNWVSRR